jgi:thiol-disulfide isomerase/thioredoxin
MANIVDVIYNYVRPYYYLIIITILIIIFSIAGYYWYNNYQKNNNISFKDVANANNRNTEVTIYFFHADWCPHCKKAEPEWNAFDSQYNGTEVNGYKIICIDVDCTSDPPTDENKALMKTYNVSSFPTIKLLKDDTVIDFDSKITRTTLESFVNTMLN